MKMGRIVGGLVLVMACGNQEAPPTTPTATPSASAAPVASETAAPIASAAPSASAAPVASASAAPEAPAMKPLKEILGGAKTIKIAWREKLDSNEAKTVTVKTDATIKGIIDAIGGDQSPGGSSPAYMWTFTLRFEDAQGNPLATVSLYSSPTMSDSNKKYGRIDVANGTFGGVVVAKYDELQKRLKSIGVALP